MNYAYEPGCFDNLELGNDKSRIKLTSCTILKNRQDACSTNSEFSCGTGLKNRQDACSTKSEFSCGTGILPVHKRLIENGATSQIKPGYFDC
ncbi:hypothetical protein D0A37_06005 [Microcoleus vaginatus HSN003]|nr:hypothetical protein D0A37_06005 [Microcoleus vaginatus HSN003]